MNNRPLCTLTLRLIPPLLFIHIPTQSHQYSTNRGNLYDTLKAGRLPQKVAKSIFAQLLAAIYYLHQKNVAHRSVDEVL